MRRLVVLLTLIALVGLSTAAVADTLTSYATTGSFSGTGASGNTLTLGGLTITFNGIAEWTDNTLFTDGAVDWSNPSLGTFVTSGQSTAGGTAAGQEFTLTIYQFVPSTPDNAVAVGSLSGAITYSGSTLMLDFSNPFTWAGDGMVYSKALPPLAGIQWAVANSTSISPPSQNGGETSLQGLAYTTPEPASLLLLAVGLTGVAGLVRRRSKA